jgi:hypothetical protein
LVVCCGLAFWAGRATAPDAAPDVPAGRDGSRAAPVAETRTDAPALAARTPNAAERKRAGRSEDETTRSVDGVATELVARITALDPGGAPDPVAQNIVPRSPAETAAAVRAFLDRGLSLDRGGGRNLRGLLERFLKDCPDEPLDRDEVFRFAWQDGTGVGWQLVHHLPREEAAKWFESFLVGGPPMEGASLGAKKDGTTKLFDDVFAAFPARGESAVMRAMESPDPDVRQLAVALALRRPGLFATALLAKATGDDAVQVRCQALCGMRGIADTGDANVRADVESAVIAAAGSSEMDLRQMAFTMLELAGARGMAIAREQIDRGGLGVDEEARIVGSLVRGGRAADVVGAAMPETRVAALIEAAGNVDDEKKQLLADLAPRAAEIPCPANPDLAANWAELMCRLGRADIAIAAARAPSRAALVRARVLAILFNQEGESSAAAVTCAGELLDDAASPTDLRRALVDVLAGADGDQVRAQVLDILRRTATGDTNAAIRSAAASAARSLASE